MPTVLSASENFAAKNSWMAALSLARAVPMDCATLMTSSTVLLTRTKKVIWMSARMLSWQIRPSRPARRISIVFTEMSIVSALWSTGRTTAPVKVTSTFLVLEMISALPCSTLRNSRVTTKAMAMTMSRTTAMSTPMPKEMASIDESLPACRYGSGTSEVGVAGRLADEPHGRDRQEAPKPEARRP